MTSTASSSSPKGNVLLVARGRDHSAAGSTGCRGLRPEAGNFESVRSSHQSDKGSFGCVTRLQRPCRPRRGRLARRARRLADLRRSGAAAPGERHHIQPRSASRIPPERGVTGFWRRLGPRGKPGRRPRRTRTRNDSVMLVPGAGWLPEKEQRCCRRAGAGHATNRPGSPLIVAKFIARRLIRFCARETWSADGKRSRGSPCVCPPKGGGWIPILGILNDPLFSAGPFRMQDRKCAPTGLRETHARQKVSPEAQLVLADRLRASLGDWDP